jgi:hypothetical protein
MWSATVFRVTLDSFLLRFLSSMRIPPPTDLQTAVTVSLQDDEVGKNGCYGATVKDRITLLLLGSSSLSESDRRATGSPIEKIYESYAEARISGVFHDAPQG